MSATLEAIDQSVIPGSYWSQFSNVLDVIPFRGAGSKLYDTDGREYIDYLLGSGPLLLGHNHPAVVEALQKQLERGTQFFMLTPQAMEMAEEIVRAVPCAEAVRYAVTGTEATFYALRFARAFTGREKILKFEGGFHGAHDYSLMSQEPGDLPPWPQPRIESGGIPRAMEELVLIAPYNDLAETERIIEQHASELAAVIAEPYQRATPPVPGFLEGLRELTRKHGIVLIYDEIVTGFRFAYGGAQEYYGVEPDIAVLGKALGGGMPLSAIVGSREIMELSTVKYKGTDKYVSSLGTFKGNAMSVASGLAALEQLRQPGVYERLHAVGKRMRAGLTDILSEYSAPFRVYGEGPLWQVLFIDHDVVNFRDSFDSDKALLGRFEHELIAGGLFLTPGIRHYISLVHTDEDIDRSLEIVAEAANKVLPR